MATNATTVMTYADWAKRLDANGRIDTIVEMLMDYNEILDDMVVQECNDGTGHKSTIRTGLPQAAWRMLNYGVPAVKTQTAQVRDTTGMLETFSKVDKKLAELSGDVSAFRLSEADGIIQGMNNQMASTLFYGNTDVNPERFLGLAPRYSTISTDEDESGFNIIDAGGNNTANGQTSIWLVHWGANSCFGLFPKGSKAGLTHEDLGEDIATDADGGEYRILRDHFGWDIGLCIRDWRYVVRIANIDVAQLKSDTTYLKALINRMIEAEERLPQLGNGKPAWYGNRAIREALRNARLEKIASNLTDDTIEGKRVTMFDEIPFRRCDALLSTEAVVT